MVLIDHPVVQIKLTELRDYTADHRKFRDLLDEVASLMVYEVTGDWPTTSRPVQTPWSGPPAGCLPAVTLGAILRAGLGMAAGVLRLLPEARLGHIGVQRNEATLEPISYYKKLPPDIASTEVLLIDPMLATGGGAIRCRAGAQRRRGDEHEVRVPGGGAEGIAALHRQFPYIQSIAP